MSTLKDVAKECGLSVTTVSRALNNRGYISREFLPIREAMTLRVFVSSVIIRTRAAGSSFRRLSGFC